MGADEDARRGEPLADAVALLLGLVTRAEQERAAEPDGPMAGWLDALLVELGPIAERVHDLVVARQLFDVVSRHGPGPWPAADLAAIARADPAAVRRVLDRLTIAGIARPTPGGREEESGC